MPQLIYLLIILRQFIEDYRFTYHDIFDQTIIDGRPIREAIFENNLEELIFDFTVTDKGDIFCSLIIRLGLKPWLIGRASYK